MSTETKTEIDITKPVEAARYGMGWSEARTCQIMSHGFGWLRACIPSGQEFLDVPVSMDGTDLREPREWRVRNVPPAPAKDWHKPDEEGLDGIELRQSPAYATVDMCGASVWIDGVCAGVVSSGGRFGTDFRYFKDHDTEPYTGHNPNITPEGLRAFATRIRAERAAAKAGDCKCKRIGDYSPSTGEHHPLCDKAVPFPPAKEEETYKPWTFETMPAAVKVKQKHGPVERSPDAERWAEMGTALAFGDGGALLGQVLIPYGHLLRDYVQLDGTPCGVRV